MQDFGMWIPGMISTEVSGSTTSILFSVYLSIFWLADFFFLYLAWLENEPSNRESLISSKDEF